MTTVSLAVNNSVSVSHVRPYSARRQMGTKSYPLTSSQKPPETGSPALTNLPFLSEHQLVGVSDREMLYEPVALSKLLTLM